MLSEKDKSRILDMIASHNVKTAKIMYELNMLDRVEKEVYDYITHISNLRVDLSKFMNLHN